MIRATRRKVRRRCATVLRDLNLPDSFDVPTLCAELSARRGRPIRKLPVPDLSGVCGLWIATDSADLIAYEQHTTLPHQNHIVLHEIGHMLCDHYLVAPDPAEQAQLLMPDLDPELIRRILGRTGYSSVEEQEAEYLASLLAQHIRPAGHDDSAAGRLRSALRNGPDHG
jgi:hypothetical protein